MADLALIIEDDLDLSTIFSEALTAAGFKTEILRDGKAAQARLNEVEPFIVILDMHLPYVSGLDLLAQIRRDERLEKVLVVICTADARMGEAVIDDADFVLIKPITFTQLRDLTRRLKQ
jgi:two-component system cell cycle response regulator DivK